MWCNILVVWQPRPGSSAPPPTLSDVFPFSAVLYAAYNIRNYCLTPRSGAQPTLGREWILQNEWVDVQFGVVNGPPYLNGVDDKVAVDEGMMTVHLVDGSNRTVVASVLDESQISCGSLARPGNGSLESIQ